MRRRARTGEHAHDLNVIPYLDVTVNLVMFLLMSMAGFVVWRAVPASAEDAGSGAADAGPPPELRLAVIIEPRGFHVATTQAQLDADRRGAAPGIPLRADGDWDLETLAEQLRALKRRHPAVSRIHIAADPHIRYETLVSVMDVARGGPGDRLFPDVTLAAQTL